MTGSDAVVANHEAFWFLVGNQKGGVGKSSMVVNVGAELAASGYRVLLVDADQQGNLTSHDLGIEGDRGQNLAVALQFYEAGQAELTPVSTGRENLDLIAGGAFLGGVPLQAASKGPQGVSELARNLHDAVSDLVSRERYDVVIFDSGPGDVIVLDVLLQCVDYLIVPTEEDTGSIDGVKKIGGRYTAVRQAGAHVELLGVVLFNMNPRATVRNRETAEEVAGFFNASGEGPSPVFTAMVRSAKSAAKDARDQHMTAAELVEAAHAGTRQRIAALRNPGERAASRRLWSRDGDSLRGWAKDYQDVTVEMLQRVAAIQSERV